MYWLVILILAKVLFPENKAGQIVIDRKSDPNYPALPYSIQWQVREQALSIGFKLAVRGDSRAGGLVAPLPCTAYFGKLAKLFGCSLPQQALA